MRFPPHIPGILDDVMVGRMEKTRSAESSTSFFKAFHPPLPADGAGFRSYRMDLTPSRSAAALLVPEPDMGSSRVNWEVSFP